MRRARIKALAAVPVRKKTVQDIIVSPDASNVLDKEQKKENVPNTDKQKQEVIEDVAKINKKEDKSDKEPVKNIENVEEKPIKKEEDKVNLSQSEAAAKVEKVDPPKLCSPVKSTFQEPQTSNKSDKINTNQLVQKIVPPPDVPTAIDLGKVYL